MNTWMLTLLLKPLILAGLLVLLSIPVKLIERHCPPGRVKRALLYRLTEY